MKKKFDEMTLDEKKEVIKRFIGSGDEKFILEVSQTLPIKNILDSIKEYWVD